MFPSPIDLTAPGPRDQVRIVSRIAPFVASEGNPAALAANENETPGKTPENMLFRRQFLAFWWSRPSCDAMEPSLM
jgi:hypothetical protein